MSTAASATPVIPAKAGPQRPRVALCEPDASLRALLGEWLLRAGYEEVRCEPGESAKGVVLVVADVPAPREHGATCIAALRQRFPRSKVLAISAQFMPGLRGATAAAIALGADAVLAKPFAAQMFSDAVQMLVGS